MKAPLKELFELLESAVSEATHAELQLRGSDYERGKAKSLKKWRKRLRDRKKVLAWARAQFPEPTTPSQP